VHGTPVPEGNRSVPQLQQILERLQPEHEAIQKLGISPQTASDFESGYEKADCSGAATASPCAIREAR